MSAAPTGLKNIFREVLQTKSGKIAIIILSTILAMSLTVWITGSEEVVKNWNEPEYWIDNPRLAAPEWVSWITGSNAPRTIILKPEDFRKTYSEDPLTGQATIQLRTRFYYDYNDVPSEIILKLNVNATTRSLITLSWIKPDGSKLEVYRKDASRGSYLIFLYTDTDAVSSVKSYLSGINASPDIAVQTVLFSSEASLKSGDPKILRSSDVNPPRPYEAIISITSRKESLSASAQLDLLGRVHGIAGTDNKRRDIFIGILWGAPVALAFGLTAALIISFVQTILGALAAFYGYRVDEVIERLTDVYLVLPFLSLLITIQFIYKTTIWTILMTVIALSIFGTITKSTRSMVLQVKEEPYIEAAISYGASKVRILFLYILPRVLPYTFANVTVLVPSYIFLEASLSLLGVGDPVLPTWGKLIEEAFIGGATFYGYWWWILIPSSLIILVSMAFALLWYSFDKILNPRLREE